MKTTNTDIVCAGCKIGKTKVTFKKPSLFKPTMITFECIDCKSLIWAKISKLPGTPPLQVNIQSRVSQVSALLFELMKQEAEEKRQAPT